MNIRILKPRGCFAEWKICEIFVEKTSHPALIVNRIYPRWEGSPSHGSRFRLLHVRELGCSPWRYCHTTWLVLIFGEDDGKGRERSREKGEVRGCSMCSLYRSLPFALSKPPCRFLSLIPLFRSFFPLLFLTPSLSRPLYIPLSRRRG